ncbi:MAG TPA: cysteine desulfurase [Bacilli bacterium]|nr:cysteine desulfurase [Bacilli bacterium]
MRRDDFPLLQQQMNDHPLAYLDNAATTQKPQQVLDALHTYYTRYNANVHRGVYALAAEATDRYEASRAKVAKFLNAPSAQQILFTKGTTEAINLVAMGMILPFLRVGDEIVVTGAEHHSNLIPWQRIAKLGGATLKFIPLKADGTLDLDAARKLIHHRTRAIAVAQISNVLGTEHPIQELAAIAKEKNAVLVVDAAQSVPHGPVDVQQLGCDFLAFSGHKAYGPTGIGVLYGKPELLEKMEPLQYGGEMIDKVELHTATYKEAPWKFEAGTPPIAEAIALGEAVDYLQDIGMEAIHAHTKALTEYAYEQLQAVDGLTIYGPPPAQRGGLIAFNLGNVHAHDIATVLDSRGIAVRAGHHCCQPLMRWLGVSSTVRASFGLYNTRAEIDRLAAALREAKEVFGV